MSEDCALSRTCKNFAAETYVPSYVKNDKNMYTIYDMNLQGTFVPGIIIINLFSGLMFILCVAWQVGN